jgi:hypothetical protein
VLSPFIVFQHVVDLYNRNFLLTEMNLLMNTVMLLKDHARIRLTINQQENEICPKPDTNDRTALSPLAESHGRCRRRPAAGRNGASLFLRQTSKQAISDRLLDNANLCWRCNRQDLAPGLQNVRSQATGGPEA